MKRGKRQVVTSNIFASEEEAHHDDDQSNFFSSIQQNDAAQAKAQQLEKPKKKEKKLNQTFQQGIARRDNSPQIVKNEQKSDVPNDRKKRLEELKKRYLKGNNQKESQKVEEKVVENEETKPEKVAPRIVEKKTDVFVEKHESKTEKEEQKEVTQVNVPQIQKQSKEKEVQVDEEKTELEKPKQMPVPSVSKKRRMPPPPPARFFNKAEEEGKKQEQIKVKNEESIEKMEQSQSEKKQEVIEKEEIMIKRQKRDSKFEQKISSWLDENSAHAFHNYLPKKEEENIGEFKLQYENQYSTFMINFIDQFIIKNSYPQTQTQTRLLEKILLFENKLQNPLDQMTLMCLLKGGHSILNKYKGLIFGESLDSNLKKIKKCKAYINDQEFQIFANFMLKSQEPTLQLVFELLKINSSAQIIIDYIVSLQRKKQNEDKELLTEIMCFLSVNLTEKNAFAYFSVIGLVISFIENEEILEKILQKITSVPFDSVYAKKKELKLKVINRMENLKRENVQKPEEKNIEKTTKSVMGFVGQAFKKITNQVVTEKPPVQEDPKEEIYYNKELKRFVLNGKVPEDEEEAQKESQKRRVPPPPARQKKVPPPPARRNPGTEGQG